VIPLGGLGCGEQAVEGAHAAAEDEELGLFLAKAFEFGGLEGGCLAEDPGDDAGLDGRVADGVERGWSFFVHGKFEI
jgi:hypothetical protein